MCGMHTQEVGCSGKCSKLDTAGKYCKLEQQVSTAGRYSRLGTVGRHLGGSQQTEQSRRGCQGQ